MQDRGKLTQEREQDPREPQAWMPALQQMITFQISGYLTEFTGGQAEVSLEASPANVREALDVLWKEHVGLRDRVLNELGQVRPHVNVFVNSLTVPRDKVLQTEIVGDAEVCIMPAVSGGCFGC
jgi:molybdopterin converting factor small subunit